MPGGAVLLVAVGFTVVGKRGLIDQSQIIDVTEQYRLLVYGAGLALALAFHRSRVFIALGGVLLVDFMSRDTTSGPETLFALGSLLVALLGLLAIARDRGVLSTGGLLQLLGASVAGSIPAALILRQPENAVALARLGIEPDWILGWLGLPPIALLVASPALLAAGYGVYRWEGAVERSLVWSQIFMLIAMHPSLTAYASLYVVGTGLILTLSVLETSYSMAYGDELTGLPGRRSLIRDLDAVGGTYTLAMVDVDYFKKFNDKHGHDVGDQVLKLVATCLAKTPGGAKAYRYGGEEFTLLFRGRTSEEALPHLEETRSAVEEARFAFRAWNRPKAKPEKGNPQKRGKSKRPRKLSVTVSMGVADSTSGDSSPDDVLKKADQALYRAKKKGRNRIIV